MTLTAHVTPRADLTPELEAGLRSLLIAAYPQFADFWVGTSYWGSEPEWHLWLADPAGVPAAQLGCGRRVAEVGGREVTLVGVGGVATHPACQRRGVGLRLLRELRPSCTRCRTCSSRSCSAGRRSSRSTSGAVSCVFRTPRSTLTRTRTGG